MLTGPGAPSLSMCSIPYSKCPQNLQSRSSHRMQAEPWAASQVACRLQLPGALLAPDDLLREAAVGSKRLTSYCLAQVDLEGA